MNRLGLTIDGLTAYHDALRAPSSAVDWTVDVLDLDENHVSSMTEFAPVGQVLVDRNAPATRALLLSITDPYGSLDFDTDSPNETAVFFNRMLQVSARVYVPALADYAVAPIFTGPVTKFRRDGATVLMEGLGKEALALSDLWEPLNVSQGSPKVDAVRLIMGAVGETRFSFPTLDARLPTGLSLGRHAKPWQTAQLITRSMGMQLYYRPDGVLSMRDLPTTPLWTFTTDADVIGPAAITRSRDQFANVVEVLGGPPGGDKTQVRAVAVVPPEHEMAPGQPGLGRNGKSAVYSYTETNAFLRSNDEAEVLATQILEDRLRSVTQPRFDSQPIYHLDEGDLVQLDAPDALVPFRLDRFALPISTKGDVVMPVGYHRSTMPDRSMV